MPRPSQETTTNGGFFGPFPSDRLQRKGWRWTIIVRPRPPGLPTLHLFFYVLPPWLVCVSQKELWLLFSTLLGLQRLPNPPCVDGDSFHRFSSPVFPKNVSATQGGAELFPGLSFRLRASKYSATIAMSSSRLLRTTRLLSLSPSGVGVHFSSRESLFLDIPLCVCAFGNKSCSQSALFFCVGPFPRCETFLIERPFFFWTPGFPSRFFSNYHQSGSSSSSFAPALEQ